MAGVLKRETGRKLKPSFLFLHVVFSWKCAPLLWRSTRRTDTRKWDSNWLVCGLVAEFICSLLAALPIVFVTDGEGGRYVGVDI